MGESEEYMTRTIEGNLTANNLRFGIIASRFNSFITDRLIEGASDAVRRCGGSDENITIIRCPGAFEIPSIAKRLVALKQFDAIICLGAVIRGATPHFEYIAAEVSKGIAAASMETGIPIAFGVITSDTIEQAVERAGTKSGNKGWDAAITAIEMAQLIKKL